jgi:hypothetical protein
MSSNCTCIAAPLSRHSQTRTRRSIPTVGALTRPGGRSTGNWCPNGCGTCVWNWGTSWNRCHCARPNSLWRSRHRASKLPRVRPRPPLLLDTALLPRLPPSKRGVSPEPTFLTMAMGRSGVQRGSRLLLMSGEERADGSLRVVYGASLRSCRPYALRAHCQWNGSVTAKPEPASACCCIRSR